MKQVKILWLAPNLNHYKVHFLNYLAKEENVSLTVISGIGRGTGFGDRVIEGNWSFKLVSTRVSKKRFGLSRVIRQLLIKSFNNYDWIMIPAEKKNVFLIIYSLFLRIKQKKTKLFSYNHPILKSGSSISTFFDRFLTKFFYSKFDKIIFYTENACQWAVTNHFIKKEKAFWANNTLDDNEISKNYKFIFPPNNKITLLFIGRLIPSKRVDIAIEYYKQLAKLFNKIGQSINLEIIGDGPDAKYVNNAIEEDSSIIWHRTLTDEKDIAPVMKRCSLVFVPGLSGLSVNHALFYGRPYATIESQFHGPEISYLQNNQNGIYLTGNSEIDVRIMFEFLTNSDQINQYCIAAINKSKEITVDKWVQQIKNALN